MSAAGNHIRQETRKEIHMPFLESKGTGVEHLTSGQCTAYLWMKRDVGGLPWKVCASAQDSWQVLMLGLNLLTFWVIYHLTTGHALDHKVSILTHN